MFWIERPDKLAAVCRAGESYTDSMISIPITDEAYEALKAKKSPDRSGPDVPRPERSASDLG